MIGSNVTLKAFWIAGTVSIPITSACFAITHPHF
jgi:hypothetical protein